MRTVLTIGREPDNDLVIGLPIVSGHHARVTWEGVPGQALIEDLGSSNGTAIGQMDKKIARGIVTATDLVYFGNHPVRGSELLGWVDPSLAPPLVVMAGETIVGRDPGCSRTIDRVTISGRHARLTRAGDRITLEDLGSSNGTFVNGERVEGPTNVRVGDLISFGVDSFRLATAAPAVDATRRVAAVTPAAPSKRASPTIRVAPLSAEPGEVGPPPAAWIYPIALVALTFLAPILGVAIGILSGDVAMALFLLSLAALWFGLSTAVVGLLLDPKRPGSGRDGGPAGFWLSRWLLLGAVCIAECLLAQVVVFPMGGVRAPGLPALGLLILASGVGLTVGTLIVMLAPRPPLAMGALAAVLVGLGLFGGGPWSLPRSAAVIRLASNVAPSRWAFEGLLVSESEEQGAAGEAGRDVAEGYFPAETDRMGPRADAMALTSMLIGLLAVGALLVNDSARGR